MSAAFIEEALPALSAAFVFHNWIAEDDINPKNLVVDSRCIVERPGLAFIDHAFAFWFKAWRKPLLRRAPPYYFCGRSPSGAGLRRAVEAIEAVSDATVRGIIGRIPAAYLPSGIADAIVELLLERRGLLRALFSPEWERAAHE